MPPFSDVLLMFLPPFVLFGARGARYLDRILKYSSCSNECFVLGLIYMDRFIQRNGFALTALNVHRVAITR